jgi:hypothetical protein
LRDRQVPREYKKNGADSSAPLWLLTKINFHLLSENESAWGGVNQSQ